MLVEFSIEVPGITPNSSIEASPYDDTIQELASISLVKFPAMKLAKVMQAMGDMKTVCNKRKG